MRAYSIGDKVRFYTYSKDECCQEMDGTVAGFYDSDEYGTYYIIEPEIHFSGFGEIIRTHDELIK